MINRLMEKWRIWVQSGDKRTACVWFAKFMAFILICTFVSRGIYAYSLPQITTDTAGMMSLSHVVEAEGEIEKGLESAVNVLPDIRVKEVYVSEGEKVVSGNELFSLDLDNLQEEIDEQKAAIEKLDLQIAAFTQNEQIAAAEKEKKLKRANEDYALGVQEATREINSASAELAGANAKRGNLSDKDTYIQEAINADSQVQSEESSLETLKKELKALKKELEELTDTTSENNTKREELEAKIKTKKSEISKREDALEIAEDSASHVAEEAWKEKQETLNDNVSEKIKSYDDTVQKSKEDILADGRAIEDANKPENADNTKETTIIEKEQLQKKLKKYQEVISDGGMVTSTKDGVITKVAVSPGDPTTDHAAILLAGTEDKLKFTAEITKEQQKYVSAGDPVEVSFDSGKIVIPDLSIQSVEKSTKKEDTYVVTVMIQAEGLSIGKAGSMRCSQTTENYPCCVPLSALHADGTQMYVLLVSESQTILGTEMTAERRDVVIADQNEKYAAIDASAGITDEKLIISATKEVMSGDKVRLKEE